VTEKEFKPRLLQVKGQAYPRVFEVEIKADSINEGDVFILDMNDKIYFWPGQDCNVTEKMKALEVATNMRKSERHCQADIMFPKENDAVDKEFWDQLGGKPAVIKPATNDEAAEAGDDGNLMYKLYKVSNETGKLTTSEIVERPLTREMLDTKDVFILELHKHVIIWIGREANTEEKKNALIIGKSFLKTKNKPKGTRVTRIVENAEDSHFKSFFNNFYPILKVDHGDMDKNVTANQDMEKVANQKHKNVKALMTKLGEYTVAVYLCVNGEN
jgi:gelsolin